LTPNSFSSDSLIGKYPFVEFIEPIIRKCVCKNFPDKVNKIHRTTLNTWYEIKSMNKKIEKLETNLFMISNNH